MPRTGRGRLLRFDQQARDGLRRAGSVLADIPPGRITHWGEFEMPAQSLKLCLISGIDRARALNYLALAFFHFPTILPQPPAAAAAARSVGGADATAKLRFLGLANPGMRTARSCAAAASDTNPTPIPTTCAGPNDLVCIYDLACTLTQMHLETLSFDANTAKDIATYIAKLPSTTALAFAIQDVIVATPTPAPDGSIDLGWATQYPIPNPATPGSYRTYSSGAKQGQTIYTTVWNAANQELMSALNANIEATLQYVKNTYCVNTTAPTTVPSSALQGNLCQVRDGTAYVSAPAPPAPTGRAALPAASAAFTYAFKNVSNQTGIQTGLSGLQNTDLRFHLRNFFVRYLGLGVQYLDSTGQPIKITNLAQATQDWAKESALFDLNDDSTIVLHLLGPELLMFGIPIESTEAELEVPYDPAASTIRVVSGGLGSFGDLGGPLTTLGIAFTAVFNLGIPTIFLVSDAAAAYSGFARTISAHGEELEEFAVLLIEEIGDLIQAIMTSNPDLWKEMAVSLGQFLLSMAGTQGLAWLVTQLITFITLGNLETALEEAIPIAGAIMLAVEIATVVATLAETIAEVIRSPWKYVSEATFTHDLTVTVNPSQCPVAGQTFPDVLWDGAGYFIITLRFDNASPQTSGRIPIADYSPVVSANPLTHTFKGVPYGGNVVASIGMYTSDGFLAAGCTTSPVPNQEGTARQDSSGTLGSECADPGPSTVVDVKDTGGNLAITMYVNEKKVPLTAETQYNFFEKTSLDANGNHVWLTAAGGASVPTATAASLNPEPKPGAVNNIYGITVNETYQSLGYSWQASSKVASSQAQVGFFANVSSGPNPQAPYLLSSAAMDNQGFPGAAPVQISYALLNGSGRNFFIDTRNGTNLVRQIVFSSASEPPTFDTSRSFGRFSLTSDLFVVHPMNTLISVNRELNKIETIDLNRYPNLPVEDADAPVAQSLSGTGDREGLVDGPVRVAVTPDGVILVLEAVNGRTQAFDHGLSPVKYFQGKTAYYAPLKDGSTADITYVGLAVEYTGYIYVLSYDNAFTYRLDIYTPDGAWLTRTVGVAAGGLAVDFWRTAYTVNYEVLMLPGTPPTLPGVTEPSVSVWLPST